MLGFNFSLEATSPPSLFSSTSYHSSSLRTTESCPALPQHTPRPAWTSPLDFQRVESRLYSFPSLTPPRLLAPQCLPSIEPTDFASPKLIMYLPNRTTGRSAVFSSWVPLSPRGGDGLPAKSCTPVNSTLAKASSMPFTRQDLRDRSRNCSQGQGSLN